MMLNKDINHFIKLLKLEPLVNITHLIKVEPKFLSPDLYFKYYYSNLFVIICYWNQFYYQIDIYI
jgi:hypothetical protein